MAEIADDRAQNDDVLDLNAAGPAAEGGSGDPAPADQSGHSNHGSSEAMRSVDDVRAAILAKVSPLSPIELHLQECFGCVLAADVTAEAELPTFASSAMDGVAVRASDIAPATMEEPVPLKIVGRALVGRQPEATVGAGEAIRIATGAPIPSGADTIVPIEHCVLEGETVLVLRAFDDGAFVRPAGQDVKAGEVLVPAGRRLAGPELGLLASAGYASLPVFPRPRVVVLSTGDELVEPGREAGYGQVRDANAYTIYGGVREAGAVPYLGGIIRDDPEALKESILGLSTRADCFVSSGGVSVGERDVVKKAFFRRGEVDFYRVAMQPGMPQGFGLVDGVLYFGLPGNPVSVFVSFEIFIRPALLKMMGRRDVFRPEIWAVAEADISGPREKTQFARVRVWRERGDWRAAPTGPPASNLLGTVARANGLAIVPVGTATAEAGSRVRVMLFRAPAEEGS